ncbi:anti-sigma factor family protein [Streptomyces meridianus]|uniref:Zf-HC2 domain-containing protein n=1 Tax=Streptomyces meridianus TaxID=2938945 RepID=A0ABT0X0W6_9ACTN|nr:zf-HC2 domain-containing protein [Streptomyces meridianus]MCM2576196.1 zf-HC2 domain-containing protein [Streptomyces meridianus]
MSGSGSVSPAEQHLGDRLAALVDGELGHDSRERVLAHLATCARCKAEADEQRRLKSVFAETAPPPPSENFLARLQMLPGGEDGPGGPSGSGSGAFGNGVFGMGGGSFGYLPATAHPAAGPGRGGFRIHEVDRPASRGRRRFAFAAAGAVSAAAFALSGAPLDVAVGGPGPGGAGAASSPPRTAPAQGRTGAGAVTSPSAGAVRPRGPASAAAPGFVSSEIEATSWTGAPAVPGAGLPGPSPVPPASTGSVRPPFPFAGSVPPGKRGQGLEAPGEHVAMSTDGGAGGDSSPAPFAGTRASSSPAPFTGR